MHPLLLAALLYLLGKGLSGQTVRLADQDGYVMATLDTRSRTVSDEKEVDVHWVRAQQLFVTQGGAGGTLLHGPFRAYHPNGQLRMMGELRKGLKHGEWRSWSPDGRLIEIQRWKQGVPVIARSRRDPVDQERPPRSTGPAKRLSRERGASTEADKGEKQGTKEPKSRNKKTSRAERMVKQKKDRKAQETPSGP